MQFYTGTSGYNYKEWKGVFYPEKISPDDMLSFYGERLNAVEINNTFYRIPKRTVVAGWGERVPEGFRFSVKASRRITHFKRLKEPIDEMFYMFRSLDELGDRLGVVLFQIHPNLKKDVPRLEAFLPLLPAGAPAAFEFRHESWFDDKVYACLERRGCALVIADAGDDPPPVVRTAPWGYFRLRKPGYTDDELAGWRDRMRATDWSHAFVFFKHEEEGAGPELAARFNALAG
jgi:uncharacterized protein YecE (DUF72 family)